jgi:ubiquinone/menaquinone biosynthesis C-methylase UbiE
MRHGNSQVPDERIRREQEFHNQRFSDDSQRHEHVGRYYLAVLYGFELYRQMVLRETAGGRRLLEYGCGTGGSSLAFAPQVDQILGIDISDVAIDCARRAASSKGLTNVSFLVQNAESLTFPDSHVDVIAGVGIIHHLDLSRATAEIRRVLRAGGVAVFAEPLAHNPLLNWYRARTPHLRSPDEHPLTLKDLRYITGQFSSASVTYFGLIAPLLGIVSRSPNRESLLTRLVWHLDKWLCRVPGLGRYAWYCIVELRR